MVTEESADVDMAKEMIIMLKKQAEKERTKAEMAKAEARKAQPFWNLLWVRNLGASGG